MQKMLGIFDWKNYIFTVIALISFSNFMVVLFGQTIPGIFSTFFKYAGETIILLAVLLFALTWFVKAKPHHKIKKYSVIVFDIFGKKSEINDIRTEFKTHDVAWSFMKQYKEAYPLYNFALVSDLSKSEKPTIFRYI
jgi:hypothetical protein